MSQHLTIGTRASPLALWQAGHVQELLESKLSLQSKIKKITTKGDTILDRSLVDVGGKGLFLKEIEEALLAGEIDIAVHSMKDVPHTLEPGLTIAAILEREDPSDAFVSRKYSSISEMPEGLIVGTSSLRRMVQLKELYPNLKYEVLRGNVDTRIKKLEAGQYDAIILASAGLIRLGLAHEIKERLSIIAGVGQGAMGIECCTSNQTMIDIIRRLDHAETRRAVDIERYFAKKIDASCQMAVGCWVRGKGLGIRDEGLGREKFMIECFWEKDGKYVRETRTGLWEEGERIVDELIINN